MLLNLQACYVINEYWRTKEYGVNKVTTEKMFMFVSCFVVVYLILVGSFTWQWVKQQFCFMQYNKITKRSIGLIFYDIG